MREEHLKTIYRRHTTYTSKVHPKTLSKVSRRKFSSAGPKGERRAAYINRRFSTGARVMGSSPGLREDYNGSQIYRENEDDFSSYNEEEEDRMFYKNLSVQHDKTNKYDDGWDISRTPEEDEIPLCLGVSGNIFYYTIEPTRSCQHTVCKSLKSLENPLQHE